MITIMITIIMIMIIMIMMIIITVMIITMMIILIIIVDNIKQHNTHTNTKSNAQVRLARFAKLINIVWGLENSSK